MGSPYVKIHDYWLKGNVVMDVWTSPFYKLYTGFCFAILPVTESRFLNWKIDLAWVTGDLILEHCITSNSVTENLDNIKKSDHPCLKI